MASRKCQWNVTGLPSTATITSPALSPARSPGSFGVTVRSRGCTFGSTPMSPTSNRLWPGNNVGVTVRLCSSPLRSRPIEISRFGFVPTAIRN